MDFASLYAEKQERPESGTGNPIWHLTLTLLILSIKNSGEPPYGNPPPLRTPCHAVYL